MKILNRKITLALFPAFSAVVCLILFSLSTFAQVRAVIRISAEANIKGDLVMLGDIAEISSGGIETSARLKAVSLGYAPSVGMTRELSKDRILLSIAAAGFTEKDFSLIAPPTIAVRRSTQVVEPSIIGEAIEKAILDEFQNKNVTAKIVRLDVPTDLSLPAGAIKVRVNASSVPNYFAPFSLPLELSVDERVARRLSVKVQIEAEAEVLVVSKDLTRGEKITAADVHLETRHLKRSPDNYLRDTEKLRGTVLLKNLSAGTELTIDAFTAGYAVRAGDSIRIIGESGKMQIIVSGKAIASGRIGDRVAVKNLQSGANLQAVVVDEGLVKVFF